MEKKQIDLKWPLVGNAHITEFLGKSIANSRVSSTYIFNGPDNLGKTTLANYFAQVLLCERRENDSITPCGVCSSCHGFLNSPEDLELDSVNSDFHILRKEKDKKKISVEQVRNFIRKLNLSSFSGGYKIGIIKHADALSTEAANALLKTLEEPKKEVVVILVTQNSEVLPQTIISRSQLLNFRLVKTDLIYDYLVNNYGVSRGEAKKFSRLALGRPALALKFFEDIEFRENYENRVNLFLGFLDQDINGRLQAIEEAIGKKTQGQESVQIVKRTLEVWQGVIRDFLLLFYNHNNIIQHYQVEENGRQNFSAADLLYWQNLCREGESNLQNNVNPKLVLENIAINI